MFKNLTLLAFNLLYLINRIIEKFLKRSMFDYFKDFTEVADIKNSHGFSFTITLKPFGTSKKAGKIRNYGPDL